jgi:hypothetical protein
VAKIIDDMDVLPEFYRCPAEHWVHLRTTNPIESTFATVRLRTKVTKGAGSRAAGIAMVYKLIDAAQARWRAVNARHLVALVRGATFHKGSCSNDPSTSRPPNRANQPKRRSPEITPSTDLDNISVAPSSCAYGSEGFGVRIPSGAA